MIKSLIREKRRSVTSFSRIEAKRISPLREANKFNISAQRDFSVTPPPASIFISLLLLSLRVIFVVLYQFFNSCKFLSAGFPAIFSVCSTNSIIINRIISNGLKLMGSRSVKTLNLKARKFLLTSISLIRRFNSVDFPTPG